MVRKIGAVVVLVGLLFWLLIKRPEPVQHIEPQLVSPKKEILDSKTDTKEQSKENTDKKRQNKPKDTILTPEQKDRFEMLKKEMATPEYSEDLYIEASMQSDQLMYCEMFTRGFLRTELKGKIKNKSWDDAYNKHCAAKRKQYPHLLVSSYSGKQLDWLPATSEMGEKFKKLASMPFNDRKQDAIELTRTALRSKKAHFLMMYQLNYSNAFDYQGWLGTNNQSYIQRITQLAFSHLLCEWDPEGLCGPNSTLMAELCTQTPSDCGMPFHDWFEKNHMPGIKKDVAIVFNKIKAYAQGEDIE